MKKTLLIASIVFAAQQVIAGSFASEATDVAAKQMNDRNQSIAQQICWDAGIGCGK